MAKRGANTVLNHDNWDDDEEPEEAGTFVQADKSTLKDRVIKKAKRRGIVKNVCKVSTKNEILIEAIHTFFFGILGWTKHICWFWRIQIIDRRYRDNERQTKL